MGNSDPVIDVEAWVSADLEAGASPRSGYRLAAFGRTPSNSTSSVEQLFCPFYLSIY